MEQDSPVRFFIRQTHIFTFPVSPEADDPAAEAAVVCDLRQRHEGEPHAEAEQTPAAGNVRNAGHLLGLAEALAVGLLDEDVDHRQIALGVEVDLQRKIETKKPFFPHTNPPF